MRNVLKPRTDKPMNRVIILTCSISNCILFVMLELDTIGKMYNFIEIIVYINRNNVIDSFDQSMGRRYL